MVEARAWSSSGLWTGVLSSGKKVGSVISSSTNSLEGIGHFPSIPLPDVEDSSSPCTLLKDPPKHSPLSVQCISIMMLVQGAN